MRANCVAALARPPARLSIGDGWERAACECARHMRTCGQEKAKTSAYSADTPPLIQFCSTAKIHIPISYSLSTPIEAIVSLDNYVKTLACHQPTQDSSKHRRRSQPLTIDRTDRLARSLARVESSRSQRQALSKNICSQIGPYVSIHLHKAPSRENCESSCQIDRFSLKKPFQAR